MIDWLPDVLFDYKMNLCLTFHSDGFASHSLLSVSCSWPFTWSSDNMVSIISNRFPIWPSICLMMDVFICLPIYLSDDGCIYLSDHLFVWFFTVWLSTYPKLWYLSLNTFQWLCYPTIYLSDTLIPIHTPFLNNLVSDCLIIKSSNHKSYIISHGFLIWCSPFWCADTFIYAPSDVIVVKPSLPPAFLRVIFLDYLCWMV